METPYQILKRLGISTNSYIKAVVDIRRNIEDKSSFNPNQWHNVSILFFKQELENFLNQPIDVDFPTTKIAYLYFGYFVQELVREMQKTASPNTLNVWETAKTKTRQFMVTFKHSTAEYEQDIDVVESWRPKAERFLLDNKDLLSKKDLIKQISVFTEKSTPYIAQFVSEMFEKHNICKQEEKKTNKLEGIEGTFKVNCHLPKNEVIDAMINKHQISKSTATSQYYIFRKKYDVPTQEEKTASIKDMVFDFLQNFSDNDLLKKDETCGKIINQFNIKITTATALFYKFKKLRTIK